MAPTFLVVFVLCVCVAHAALFCQLQSFDPTFINGARSPPCSHKLELTSPLQNSFPYLQKVWFKISPVKATQHDALPDLPDEGWQIKVSPNSFTFHHPVLSTRNVMLHADDVRYVKHLGDLDAGSGFVNVYETHFSLTWTSSSDYTPAVLPFKLAYIRNPERIALGQPLSDSEVVSTSFFLRLDNPAVGTRVPVCQSPTADCPFPASECSTGTLTGPDCNWSFTSDLGYSAQMNRDIFLSNYPYTFTRAVESGNNPLGGRSFWFAGFLPKIKSVTLNGNPITDLSQFSLAATVQGRNEPILEKTIRIMGNFQFQLYLKASLNAGQSFIITYDLYTYDIFHSFFRVGKDLTMSFSAGATNFPGMTLADLKTGNACKMIDLNWAFLGDDCQSSVSFDRPWRPSLEIPTSDNADFVTPWTAVIQTTKAQAASKIDPTLDLFTFRDATDPEIALDSEWYTVSTDIVFMSKYLITTFVSLSAFHPFQVASDMGLAQESQYIQLAFNWYSESADAVILVQHIPLFDPSVNFIQSPPFGQQILLVDQDGVPKPLVFSRVELFPGQVLIFTDFDGANIDYHLGQWLGQPGYYPVDLALQCLSGSCEEDSATIQMDLDATFSIPITAKSGIYNIKIKSYELLTRIQVHLMGCDDGRYGIGCSTSFDAKMSFDDATYTLSQDSPLGPFWLATKSAPGSIPTLTITSPTDYSTASPTMTLIVARDDSSETLTFRALSTSPDDNNNAATRFGTPSSPIDFRVEFDSNWAQHLPRLPVKLGLVQGPLVTLIKQPLIAFDMKVCRPPRTIAGKLYSLCSCPDYKVSDDCMSGLFINSIQPINQLTRSQVILGSDSSMSIQNGATLWQYQFNSQGTGPKDLYFAYGVVGNQHDYNLLHLGTYVALTLNSLGDLSIPASFVSKFAETYPASSHLGKIFYVDIYIGSDEPMEFETSHTLPTASLFLAGTFYITKLATTDSTADDQYPGLDLQVCPPGNTGNAGNPIFSFCGIHAITNTDRRTAVLPNTGFYYWDFIDSTQSIAFTHPTSTTVGLFPRLPSGVLFGLVIQFPGQYCPASDQITLELLLSDGNTSVIPITGTAVSATSSCTLQFSFDFGAEPALDSYTSLNQQLSLWVRFTNGAESELYDLGQRVTFRDLIEPGETSIAFASYSVQDFALLIHFSCPGCTINTAAHESYEKYAPDEVWFRAELWTDSDTNGSQLLRILPVTISSNSSHAPLLTDVYQFPHYVKEITVYTGNWPPFENPTVYLRPIFTMNPKQQNGSLVDLAPVSPLFTMRVGQYAEYITSSCPNSDRQIAGTGECHCSWPYAGPDCTDFADDRCALLKCPTHMVPNSNCDQCICTTYTCSANTRTFLTTLQLNNDIDVNQSVYKNYGIEGLFTHLLPQQLGLLLGLNKFIPEPELYAEDHQDGKDLLNSLPKSILQFSTPIDTETIPAGPIGIEDIFVSIVPDYATNQSPKWTVDRIADVRLEPTSVTLLITITNQPFIYKDFGITGDDIQNRFTTLGKRFNKLFGIQSNSFSTLSAILQELSDRGDDAIPAALSVFGLPSKPGIIALNSLNSNVSILPKSAFPPNPINQPVLATRCYLPTSSTTFFPCPTPTNVGSKLWQSNSSLLIACVFLGRDVTSTISALSTCPGAVNYQSGPRPILPALPSTYKVSWAAFNTHYSINEHLPLQAGKPFSIKWTLDKDVLYANRHTLSVSFYLTTETVKNFVLKTVTVPTSAQSIGEAPKTTLPQETSLSIPLRFAPLSDNGQVLAKISVVVVQNPAKSAFTIEHQITIQRSEHFYSVECLASDSNLAIANPSVDVATNECSCPPGSMFDYWFTPGRLTSNDISLFSPAITAPSSYDPSLYKCVAPCYPTKTSSFSNNKCTCSPGYNGAMCATPNCNKAIVVAGVTSTTIFVSESCSNKGFDLTCTPSNTICQCLNQFSGPTCNVCPLMSTGACHQHGTNATATNVNCSQCVCKPGVYTPKCAYRSMLGSISFSTEGMSNVPTPGEVILLTPTQQELLIRELANSLSLPTELVLLRAALFAPAVKKSGSAAPTTSITRRFVFELGSSSWPPNSDNPNNSNIVSTLEDFLEEFNNFLHQFHVLQEADTATSAEAAPTITQLHDLWTNLQTNFKESPLFNSPDIQEQIGQQPEELDDGFDANCDATVAENNCPTGSDPLDLLVGGGGDGSGTSGISGNSGLHSTTLIIIIVVVVVGGALAITALMIALFMCKKRQKCCFTPKKDTKDDPSNVEFGVTGRSRTATSASASPSATFVTESGAIDLIEIPLDDGEAPLPSGWKKMKHTQTQDTIFVNDTLMKSQTQHPNEAKKGGKWF